jgi:ribosomal protein S2
MVSLEMMLSSSVHLGHQVQQWNPKMSPYIYGERNGVHIIDLLQTLVCLEKACKFLSVASRKNKTLVYLRNFNFIKKILFEFKFYLIFYFLWNSLSVLFYL